MRQPLLHHRVCVHIYVYTHTHTPNPILSIQLQTLPLSVALAESKWAVAVFLAWFARGSQPATTTWCLVAGFRFRD